MVDNCCWLHLFLVVLGANNPFSTGPESHLQTASLKLGQLQGDEAVMEFRQMKLKVDGSSAKIVPGIEASDPENHGVRLPQSDFVWT